MEFLMEVGDLVKLNLGNADRGIGIIVAVNTTHVTITPYHKYLVFWPKDNVEYVYRKDNLHFWKEASKLSNLIFRV